MAKIAEIVAQNPWWKHGAEFARFDKNLREARPIFGKNHQEREGHRSVSGPQTAALSACNATGLHVHKCVLTVMSKKFKINKE